MTAVRKRVGEGKFGEGGDKLLIFDPPSLDYSRETRGGGGNRFLQPSLQHS